MDKGKKTPSRKSRALDEAYQIVFAKHLQESCFSFGITTSTLCYILNADIKPGFTWSTYPHEEIDPDIEIIVVYIAFENFSKSGSLNQIFIKNQNISHEFLEAMFEIFPQYTTLSNLKLEYCNLTSDDIENIQKMLAHFRNIIDLSLNGNPINQQNYNCLVKETNLKYLSLQRCKINEIGMKLLSENLALNNVLTTLDLTGNHIDDEGAKYLAEMLRENRKLRIIILADNWITDTGCYDIMSSLQKFILNHDEIVKRRKMRFKYLLEKTKTIKEFKDNIEKSSLVRNSSNISKKKSFETNIDKIEQNEYKDLEENIVEIKHPFAADCLLKDFELYCFGNLKLTFLNLAYNKIGITGYKHIIEILNYQISNNFFGMGLTYLILDGNKYCNSLEYKEIMKLLFEKKLKSRTSSKTNNINRISLSTVSG